MLKKLSKFETQGLPNSLAVFFGGREGVIIEDGEGGNLFLPGHGPLEKSPSTWVIIKHGQYLPLPFMEIWDFVSLSPSPQVD